MIPLSQVLQLPEFHRETIPEDYLDIMGHMNIRWYIAMFDEAMWKFFASFGMDAEYYKRENAGGFALKHFIQYFAEVRVGETVAVRSRLIGRSAKRIHFIHFMVNESTNKLTATMEVLGTHADMEIRRTAPFPTELADLIDSKIAEYNALDWDPPICGILHP
jgi:acyl-CoA thioester hydrolase